MTTENETSFGIGRLAELSGLPVKTIRFYSDGGLLPAGRSEAGHRRYSETDLARLQLIRSLRDLGLDLHTIRHVLEGHDGLGDVLAAHAVTLQTQIRRLRRQLVVLRATAARPDEAHLRRVHALARLDAAERRMLLERFWERAVGDAGNPQASARLRQAAMPELGDDPSPEQLDAWLELAELAMDEDYQRAVRDQIEWPKRVGFVEGPTWLRDYDRVMGMALRAFEDGAGPDDAPARQAVDAFAGLWARSLNRTDGPAFRTWLAEGIETGYDARIARYWQLVGIVRGENPGGSGANRWEMFTWLLRALKASAVPDVTGRPQPRTART